MATTTLSIAAPAASDLQNEVSEARMTADMILITDDASLQIATAEMNRMAKRVKELEAARKKITQPIDQAKKNVMALFKPATDGYTTAINKIKLAIAVYHDKREREIAEARAKAEAEAAEQRKALEAAAEAAESPEEAQALADTAAMVTAAPVAAPEKTSGMSVRKVWKAEIADKAAFLAHVAQHPELLECVDVRIAALERFISATGGAVVIPGVTIHQETQIATRG